MKGPTVGILSPLMAGNYYGSLISTVNQSVSGAGGLLVAICTAAFSSGYHREHVIEGLPRLGWARIDGFITIADAVSLAYLESLARAGKPVVALGHEEPGFSYPAVLPDNRGGAEQALKHLIEHGHTRIAFAGCLRYYDVRERYAAYCDCLRAHGIQPDPSLLYDIEDNHEFAGRDAGRRMVAAGLPSTAVMAACDPTAVGVMAVLKEAGYLLPTDQAVVGFDDHPGNTSLSPALSSVSQHLEEMGSLAARLVMRMVAGEAVAPTHHVVEGALAIRESCGCAPKPLAHDLTFDQGHADPVIAFTAALAKAVRRGPGGPGVDLPVDKVNRLTAVIESTVRQAVGQEISPEDLLKLSLACRDLYALGRNQATSDAIGDFARHMCMAVTTDAGRSGTTLLNRLNACVAEVQLGLAKALLNERSEAFYDLRRAIRDEHEISVDLLRSHESDPRRLGWLARTRALAGMLAMWKRDAAGPDAHREEGTVALGQDDAAGASCDGAAGARPDLDLRREAGAGQDDRLGQADRLGHTATAELEVVGTFEADGGHLLPRTSTYPVEFFPPPELFDAAGVGNILLLFPVTSQDRDWGILAVAVPLDSGFLGQDTYFQWEALLSEALDYQDVLRSLRDRSRELHERGEQLALSYRREREMAQAVRESEERYALAARAANDGMWDWDLDRGSVYYSQRWSEMLGYPQTAIGTTPEEWLDRVHDDDRPGLTSQLVSLKLGEQASILHEHRVRTRDAGYIWVMCRGLAVPGVGKPATRIVGSLTDVTERRLLEEQLRQQALFDSLTGLPNRVLFLDRLAQGIANCKRRAASTYTVLWLDLDGFKILNDSLGHQMGDKLLVQVADRIRSQLRGSDTAARFGGDEFAILLLDIPGPDTIRTVVERVLDHLGALYDLEGHEIGVTASIGVASSINDYDHPEDALRDADIAMYRAKSKGRGTYAVFDPSMHATAMTRLRTETELRQAIEPRDQGSTQMELHYQPVVDLVSGDVTSLEALARWRHPLRGLITPLEFLQVAEDSGLILPMGRWVAAQACRQLALWNTASVLDQDVRVSLNLSNREFWSPRLLFHLDLVLKESGVLPERLAFEITEGVLIDNLDRAMVVLHELHARGLQVHVDDFGTGYSSLQALHRLPIDALKIDKSFIAGLGHDDRTAELVGTIVQLGRNLGVQVIAEGVETLGQHESLRRLGCAYGQGYLFSAPVPAAELGALLATGRLELVGDWRQ